MALRKHPIIDDPSAQSEGDVLVYDASEDAYDPVAQSTLVGAYPTAIEASVRRATVQAISTSTGTPVSFSTELSDTDSIWAIGDPTKFVAPRAGLYHFTASAGQWEGHATGWRETYFYLNGTTIVGNDILMVPSDSAQMHLPPHSVDVRLAATDVIEFYVWQNSGGDLDIGDASALYEQPHMSCFFVGA